MTSKNSLTSEQLRKLLDYDLETGVFTWRVNRGKARVGRIAGTKHNRGYLTVVLDQKVYLLHRLAWFWVHDAWPIEIDHRDRVKTNNRIDNLRQATRQQNLRNTGLQKSNTSGIVGVSWHKRRKKWRAMITIDSKFKELGFFDAISDAAFAREVAEITHFGDFRVA